MNLSLAQALINRGIINNTTRIIAKCPVWGMGQAPALQRLPLTVDKVVFEQGEMSIVSFHRDGRRFVVPLDKIELIDGMNPVRLAAAYDIKDDGLKKLNGKKRGRKPKNNNKFD